MAFSPIPIYLFALTLLRIIAAVDIEFLILIAIPLGVYLVILIFSLRDLSAAESDVETPRAGDEPIRADLPSLEMSTIQKASNLNAEMASARATTPIVATPADSSRTIAPTPPETRDEVITESAAPMAELDMAAGERVESSSFTETSDTEPPRDSDDPPLASQTISAVEPARETPPTDQIEISEPHEAEEFESLLPEGPLEFPAKGSPQYAFDYRGRLWVEKKRKSFFRQLRRPQIPPEEPS